MIKALFPVLLYFSAGYLSRKFRLFDENASQILIKFIIYISFPALVIYNVYFLKFQWSFLWVLLSGWGVILFSILVSFFIGKALKLNKPTLASFIMMATFGNTSFLGFPYQMAFLGEEGLRYAVVFDQFSSFLPVSLISPFILTYGQDKGNFSVDIKRIITFPPFVAIIFAFFIKNFYIPDFVLDSLKMIGMTVIPLALFSVGINLKFSSVKERIRDISAVIFIKMIFVPVLFVLLLHIIGVEINIQWQSAVIEIAMPPMVLASIFVIGAGLDKDLAVSAVGVGILASFITVPFVFYLLNTL
ncbi:AEC family transporter [Persephonella sp. KM09-Lau-8]|uniref:AEC family transporter n=1 Tax=Persephonella sp. KM09-Lau-8 TaxID=1158345 RepID=UPI000495769A|nr:AEC family transporter [Persephonella sp. KM09-Lau-8]